jgi:hypothetical protein
MRDFSMMSDEERQQIRQQHSKLYDGYVVGNVPSNMTPLTVYDAARDKEGITVTPKGDVKTYRNHKINEIAAKNLHYDEIDPAYEFDSVGPGDENLGYNVYNSTKPPFDFDSQGPADPYYGGGYQSGDEDTDINDSNDTTEFDTVDFDDYIDDMSFDDLVNDESLLDKKEDEIEEIYENINKTKDMFKRFKKFN